MNKFDFSARKAQLNAIVKAAEGIKDRKSKERKAAARATRKLSQIAVFEEMLALMPKDAKLTEDTQEYIKSLTVEYTPGTQLEIQAGDSLIELLEEYKDVKDLYKKILKWCEKNDCHIDGVTITKNEQKTEDRTEKK